MGWPGAGDAGCHKAPYMALGICDALRDAEFLAEAIGAGLTAQCPFEDGLADYERRRNEASAADYQQNVSAARFQPFPDGVLRLRAAIQGNP
jgi:2-polyprenyl-6-methoxyphenol hydroxylase-like FAD-dependent oxidoreductase